MVGPTNHLLCCCNFLLDFLPSNAKLPKDCYKARKIIKDLGLSYEKIHACPKDCTLYWKENANLVACPICNCSRWESNESKGQQITNASSKKKKRRNLQRSYGGSP